MQRINDTINYSTWNYFKKRRRKVTLAYEDPAAFGPSTDVTILHPGQDKARGWENVAERMRLNKGKCLHRTEDFDAN